MYVGLAPKILGVCVEHFSSLLVSDYIKDYKSENEIDLKSDLEMWV